MVCYCSREARGYGLFFQNTVESHTSIEQRCCSHGYDLHSTFMCSAWGTSVDAWNVVRDHAGAADLISRPQAAQAGADHPRERAGFEDDRRKPRVRRQGLHAPVARAFQCPGALHHRGGAFLHRWVRREEPNLAQAVERRPARARNVQVQAAKQTRPS